MKLLDFTKMHGAGNDFVVLDGLGGSLPGELGELARRLSDRHFGVGADQVLVLLPSERADVRMDVYDADGSRVEMCGNGIRAIFKYLRDRGLTEKDELTVETDERVVRPRWVGPDLIRVDMGAPILEPGRIPTRLGSGAGPVLEEPLEVQGQSVRVSCVSMGNPHAVLYVADVDAAPLESLGAAIENHPAFPNRVNVELVQLVTRDRVRQRTWERGTGETLACGSGACAAVVAAVLSHRAERELEIRLRGGTLGLRWPEDDGPVWLTGPATHVFDGELELP